MNSDYIYRDEDGKELYRMIRYNGKDFRLSPPGAPPALYNLPYLKRAREDGDTIFFVEGEKDADALGALGLISTTLRGGADAPWEESYSEVLAGCSVVVIPDNDEPGRKHAEKICKALHGLSKSLQLLNLPGLPEKGDVSDWLEQGGTKEEFLALVDNCSEWNGDKTWGEPEPLENVIDPLPYPLEKLPYSLRLAIEEAKGITQAPTALIASSALATLSAAVQHLYNVCRDENLESPTSLFLLTIAESGERKTTCDNIFSSEITDYEKEVALLRKPELLDFEVQHAAWQAKKSGLESKLKQVMGNEEDTTVLEARLESLMLDKPKRPRIPRIMRKDETPESLAWSLFSEWPSCALLCSEAGVIFGSHGNGRDSIMRNLSQQNILWDGGDISVGRKSSDSFVLRGARLTQGLLVQEAPLRQFLENSKGLARGIGFIARFLVAWPESTQGTRFYQDEIKTMNHINRFKRKVREIVEREPEFDEYGVLSPKVLRLSGRPKDLWIDFYNRTEKELSFCGLYSEIRDIVSKAGENVARIAALFTVLEGEEGSGLVSEEAMRSAIACVEWHLHESLRFHGLLVVSEKQERLEKLDRWLVDRCIQEDVSKIPILDLSQRGPSSIRDKKSIDSILEELSSLNRAKLQNEGRKKFIAVNPQLVAKAKAAKAAKAARVAIVGN